tara:strand:+ start:136 stop:861 length:726 start_codon:yes stop_codon:yes gene_type:complete
MNKKIFITGSTGGIGKAICEKFLSENFKLILTSSSEKKIDELKKIYGDKNFYYQLNISSEESITKCTDDIINNHKDLGVIVNNAGITEDNLLLRMKSDQWNNVINTNLNSNYHIIKSLLPIMLANRYGKIIGISSVIASTGNPGQSNYAASKSGMIGFYKSVAHEVAKRNINVNTVSPGYIITPMTNKLNDTQKSQILSKIPMNKFGTPADVANLVYFLSTSESSYITGQNFNVNGGMIMF